MKRSIHKLLVFLLFITNGMMAQELIPYCKNGIYGYSDLQGKMIIAPAFEAADLFVKERAIVKQEGRFYLVDPKGNRIGMKSYTDMKLEGNGCYTVSLDDSMGVIDRNNKIIVPILYKELEFPGIGIRATRFSEKDVFLTLDGKKVLESDSTIQIHGDRYGNDDSLYALSYRLGKKDLGVLYTRPYKKIAGPLPGRISIEKIENTDVFIIELSDESTGNCIKTGLIDRNGNWIVKLMPAFDSEVTFGKEKYEKRNLREQLYEERFTNPEAYADLLKEIYVMIAGPDSIIKIVTVTGQEVYKMLLTKNNVTVFSKTDKLVIKPKMNEEITDCKFTDDGLLALYITDSVTKVKFTYLFKNGVPLSKKPFTKVGIDEGYWKELNLLGYEQDSLQGLMFNDGRNYVSRSYTEDIALLYDSIIVLTKPDGQFTYLTFPKSESSITESEWYTTSNFGGSGLTITGAKINGTTLYGVYDKNLKMLYKPVFYGFKTIDNFLRVYTNELQTQYMDLGASGVVIPNCEGCDLLSVLDGPKKQYVYQHGEKIVLRSGDKPEYVICHLQPGDNVAVWNKATVNGIFYFSIIKNDQIGIFSIQEGVKQTFPFTDVYNPQSHTCISLMNKDSLTNFILLDGTEIIPYGKWDYIEDVDTWNRKTATVSGMVYIANGPATSVAYNSKKEKLFECHQCKIGWQEEFYNASMFNFVVSSTNPGKFWSIIYLYSDASQKIVPIPFVDNGFADNGYEYLSDTSFLFRDTSKAAYIYFVPQQQLIKMPFAYKDYSHSDAENTSYFFFRDTKDKYHYYDTKNAVFVDMPGYINDFSPLFETFKNSQHQYFYFYADSTLAGKGIMDETGKILVKPDYREIDMLMDYEEYAMYMASNEQRTDFIPLKGEPVSTGKKYEETYFDDESVLTAPYMENEKRHWDLFNAYNNYKPFKYDFLAAPEYVSAIKIGDRWLLRFRMTYYESGGSTTKTDHSYFLYIDQDGKPYFEFDDHLKVMEN